MNISYNSSAEVVISAFPAEIMTQSKGKSSLIYEFQSALIQSGVVAVTHLEDL